MLQIYEINPRLSFISQFFLKNIGVTEGYYK